VWLCISFRRPLSGLVYHHGYPIAAPGHNGSRPA
jgi:hypothetical protein